MISGDHFKLQRTRLNLLTNRSRLSRSTPAGFISARRNYVFRCLSPSKGRGIARAPWLSVYAVVYVQPAGNQFSSKTFYINMQIGRRNVRVPAKDTEHLPWPEIIGN